MYYIYDPLYRALNTKSKKTINKVIWRYGHWYNYKPRRDLIRNLSQEFNLSEDEVRDKLADIRWQILVKEGFAHVPQLNPFI